MCYWPKCPHFISSRPWWWWSPAPRDGFGAPSWSAAGFQTPPTKTAFRGFHGDELGDLKVDHMKPTILFWNFMEKEIERSWKIIESKLVSADWSVIQKMILHAWHQPQNGGGLQRKMWNSPCSPVKIEGFDLNGMSRPKTIGFLMEMSSISPKNSRNSHRNVQKCNSWGLPIAHSDTKVPWILVLVGGWATPLKNMSSSIGMIRHPIFLGKCQSQPNHQPE